MESDPDPHDAGRHERTLPGWLSATPGELVGLAVLVTGALVATLLLWLHATARPDPSALAPGAAPAVGSVGVAVDAQGHAAGPAPGVDDRAARELPAVAADVTVYVSGAVVAAGVVVLPPGARVGEAIAAAGGLTPDADEAALNLARVLVDGEQVHVPVHGEAPRPSPADGAASGGGGVRGTLDLNRASVAELEALPGIGPAKAAAIVRHRDEHGPFAVPGDLRDVPGIGEATFQALAGLVVAG